jgi:carboxyl-terminal processing protease
MEPSRNDTQKNWNIWQPFLLSSAVVVGMLVGFRLQDIQPSITVHREDVLSSGPALGQFGRMEELIRYIDAKYVDEVDEEELVETAVNNLLKELDPHSSYISKERLQEVNEQLDGSFEGIGIEFMIVEDTIVVVTPVAGGPSYLAGVLPGDKIVAINDTLIGGEELNSRKVVKRLKGEKGSTVKVGVLRGQEEVMRIFEITRDEIPINSLDAAYMLAPEIGYIRLNRFSGTTYTEVMEAMEKLIDQEGMKHLVLDLRQNPGGYLQEATKLLSQLFNERSKLLVYTEGENVRRNDYETTGKNFFKLDKIAVLIDEGSASASEIVAGAIQDWDRGVIVGRRSFGKGLVQEQYNLRDGSALRLTVARYYTPSGRSIQVPYENLGDYQEVQSHRMDRGELVNGDEYVSEDTTRYYTAGGRTVFGGGGIMPDVFVPADTLLLNAQVQHLQQYIPEFILKNISRLKEEIGEDLSGFTRNYSITDEFLEDYLNYAREKHGLEGEEDLEPDFRQTVFIRNILKARIARQFFNSEGYYRVKNEDDPTVQAALRALKSSNPLTYEYQ